jgi:uncharacterized protein (DUF608 family)
MRGRGRIFRGEALRNVAMPLGGIGTGQIAIAGDGGLRQWQISNIPNHLASVPDAFFALSTTKGDGTSTRILQSEEVLALEPLNTPCVNDEVVPQHQRDLVARHGGVTRTTFTGAYPFATVAYEDANLSRWMFRSRRSRRSFHSMPRAVKSPASSFASP